MRELQQLTKWPNTLKQFVGNLPTNCLSVFGHFVGLAFKGLILRPLELARINSRRRSKSVLYTLPGISTSTHDMKLEIVTFIVQVKK